VVFEGRAVALEADVEQASDIDDAETLWGYKKQGTAKRMRGTTPNGSFRKPNVPVFEYAVRLAKMRALNHMLEI
jgi:hypothetical protein